MLIAKCFFMRKTLKLFRRATDSINCIKIFQDKSAIFTKVNLIKQLVKNNKRL